MADFYWHVLAAVGGVVTAFIVYGVGLLRGNKLGNEEGYHRGFIAARIKFEIPRNSQGRFVKKDSK